MMRDYTYTYQKNGYVLGKHKLKWSKIIVKTN